MKNFHQEIDQLIAQGRFKQASNKIKAAQKKQAKNSELVRLEGIIKLHQKKLSLAERDFKRAIEFDNHNAAAMANLAFIKHQKKAYQEAEEWLTKSIKINPYSIEAQHQLGIVANAQDKHELAERQFHKVLQQHPGHNDCLINLAILLKNKGDLNQAIHYLHKALDINPMQADIYWILANLKSYQFTQSEIEMINLMLQKEFNQKDREALLFTQAKILEDQKKYKQSFEVLKQANNMTYQSLQRKPVDWYKEWLKIESIFSPEYVKEYQNTEPQDASPVLIAGMPRSGSTLIEQILASHPKITGASELKYLEQLINQVPQGYPMGFKNFDLKLSKNIADKYTQLTRKWTKTTHYFTDKMPRNINWAGVLLMAVPNSKLIHTRRHAMDVCLSAFKQKFENGSEYTYDLTELVHYYQFQEKVAELWKILFPDRVLHVNYEDVINHTEQQVRRILQFLGLDFDSACLQFHQTERVIKTASAGQVTQKIYKSAQHYYQHYGDALDELSALLKKPFASQ